MSHRTCRWLALSLLPLLASVVRAEDADPKIVVIDLRPPEEKEGNGLRELEGKCNADVYRIADVATSPLKFDLLKADLEQMMPASDERRTLTVLDWSIYYNKQIHKNEGSFLKSVGVQGYTIPNKSEGKKPGSNCSQKESAGGWYMANEVTGVYFPLVSEFSGTFAGKPISVRLVYSPTQKLEGKFQGDARDTDALMEAIHKTSEEVASAMGR
jgi:hypothetical protein